jgi:hypothetical protein
MKPFDCEKEPLVLEAVRTGEWNDELRRHTTDCSACSDAALASSFLLAMREEDRAEARVPHAGRVWWKAQLQARRQAAERAARPITLAQTAAFAFAALAFAGICVWQWPVVHAWLGSLYGGWHFNAAPVSSFVVNLWQTSSSTVIMGASAVLVFLTFIAYLVWKEE